MEFLLECSLNSATLNQQMASLVSRPLVSVNLVLRLRHHFSVKCWCSKLTCCFSCRYLEALNHIRLNVYPLKVRMEGCHTLAVTSKRAFLAETSCPYAVTNTIILFRILWALLVCAMVCYRGDSQQP